MICEKIEAIQQRITAAVKKADRKASDITLVAVSKRFPTDAIEQAINCGQTHFGENYAQEASEKKDILGGKVKIHFIGNLQSNKAKIAARCSSIIETVDRIKIAKILNKEAALLNKKLDILIQVNVGEETQKSGVLEKDAIELINSIHNFKHLQLKGLMTIPPFDLNSEETRPYFIKLRKLSEQLINQGILNKSQTALSMGMSNDYDIAIEEGATIVRVGTAIFGKRP